MPVRRLFAEAADAGVGQRGLTIPICGPEGDHAIFTLTSDLPPDEWRAVRRAYSRDMQVIAHYVHARVLDLRGLTTVDQGASLSAREREALLWAAHGKTIDETAMIVGLSRNTGPCLPRQRSPQDGLPDQGTSRG